MSFHGFYDYVSHRPDQRDQYRRWLETGTIPFGYSSGELEKKLSFDDRFPPNEPFERVLTHKVEIYDANFSPLVNVDFAKELEYRKGEPIEKIIERGVVVKISDRFFVRGDKIELVSPHAEDLEKATSYMKVEFGDANKTTATYNFLFRREAFHLNLQYHITTTFIINGVLWQQNKKIGRVVQARSRSSLTRHPTTLIRYRKDPSFHSTRVK